MKLPPWMTKSVKYVFSSTTTLASPVILLGRFEESSINPSRTMLVPPWILGFLAVGARFAEPRRIDATLGNFIVDVALEISSPSTVTALLCVNDGQLQFY